MTLQTSGRGPSNVVDSQQPRPDTTSRELIQRIQDGDRDAFGELWQQHRPFIYRYLYRRLRHQQTAEDFTSETFLKALRALNNFTWQGAEPSAWLVTIARNLVTDHYKSLRHRVEVVSHPLAADEQRPDDSRHSDPAAAAIAALDTEMIHQAIWYLSDDQRTCIALHYLQGMSYHEAAAVMGKEYGATKSLRDRGLRRLAAILPREAA